MVNKSSTGWREKLAYSIFLLVLVPICFEAALWILQYRPYQRQTYSIEAEPAAAVVGHPTLGFALSPGVFQVTINQGLTYQATHSPDSQRVTSANPVRVHPEIWLFGCSYTYGMGVNDEETFAWKLQEKLPQHRVVNFGVPGFGTVQTLLQLKTALSRDSSPEAVILNFADFHPERNVLAPRYRQALSIGYRMAVRNQASMMENSQIPFAVYEGDHVTLTSEDWGDLYQDWRGRELLCSVNFWQTFADNIHQADLLPESVTIHLIAEMAHQCRIRHIPFLVSGLTSSLSTSTIFQHLNEQDIQTADISVDLSQPEFTHHPYDSHPNARAHAIFADRLHNRLELILSEQEN